MGRLLIRVRPGARRTEFAGWFGDVPRMTVAAPPVDGAANDELVRTLAKLFGVRSRDVRLVGGGASRTKRFEIEGVDDATVASIVGQLNPREPPVAGRSR